MSDKPKTAVQVAISEIKKRIDTYQSINAFGHEQLIKEQNKRALEECVYILELLLGMERENIKNAYISGIIHPLEMEASKQAEQYYTETYGE